MRLNVFLKSGIWLLISCISCISCTEKVQNSSRTQTVSVAGSNVKTKDPAETSHVDEVSKNTQGAKFILTSKFFAEGEDLPQKNTCESDNLSPLLTWEFIPPKTKSFVILMDDLSVLDSVNGKTSKTHWLIYSMSEEIHSLEEGVSNNLNSSIGVQGLNDFNHVGYDGPCPLPQDGAHDYLFKIFALKEKVPLEPGKTKQEVLSAIANDILEVATLQVKFASKAK